jgi:hypothetical protein
MTQKPHFTKLEEEQSEVAEHEEALQVHNEKYKFVLQCNLGQFKPQEIVVSVLVLYISEHLNRRMSFVAIIVHTFRFTSLSTPTNPM